jgi:hypothetical protein
MIKQKALTRKLVVVRLRSLCDLNPPYSSIPSQYQIQCPTPAAMLAGFSKVVQDVVVVAPGVLKGIGKDGEAVEGFVGVDAVGENKDGRREPGGVECDRAEEVAEDVTEQGAYLSFLLYIPFCREGRDDTK